MGQNKPTGRLLNGPVRPARLCASRPLRYVSVINDNHLISLMNFIATKVN
jgi:hypothetical protein